MLNAGTSRMVISCCALLAGACGAGDNQLDPSDLELRDLLGIAPETAAAWDSSQRAAARHVIEAGLEDAGPPIVASLDTAAPTTDQRVAKSLASIDADHALGLVHVAIAGGAVHVTPRATTIEPQGKPPVEIWLSGWDSDPLWELPPRGLDLMSSLAIDAGHTSGPVVVTPAPRLAVVASYVPSTPTEHARLAVNPVVLAALDPVETGSSSSSSATTSVERTVSRGSSSPDGASVATYATMPAAANPYSFYGSVAECAAAEHARCSACLANNSCSPITSSGNGNEECTEFDANGGRGYFLICIDLALAIDSVSKCTAAAAPSCTFDAHAADSLTTLENNASFLDDGSCGGPLDNCLATIYGASKGDFPGPGVDGGTSSQPRDTSTNCSNSCSNDSNCDDDTSCELDGPSCDDSEACDGSCSDSDEQSGCSDSGGDGGGGGCGGDSEDSCGSENSSGCDNGDCGGGGGDSGCGGGGGGDCGGGGGGDCGGGGGDCGGGGGDCGGGDCNAAGKRGHSGVTLEIVWAFLPIPFAAMVRRRARRKRAVAEYEAQETTP